MYEVIKRYGHEMGLSSCFRQPYAASHCRFMHGYALAFELTFRSETLNRNGWTIDFGGLKEIKQWLCDTFDHKTLIDIKDPELDTFKGLHEKGLIDLTVVPRVGCEGFAELVFERVDNWLKTKIQLEEASVDNQTPDFTNKPSLYSVRVQEHLGNAVTRYATGFTHETDALRTEVEALRSYIAKIDTRTSSMIRLG